MLSIKKILVPTDFSEGADFAYLWAHKLAMKFNAKVDLIHVIPAVDHLNILFTEKKKESILRNEREEAEKLLESAFSSFDKVNRGKYYVFIDRKPSEVIVSHADKHSYDLIVMGSRGSHNSKLRRGGTTEKTIRNSKIPVLAVDDKALKSGIHEILMPTDSSQLSFTSLPLTVTLAAVLNTSITLFYVMEMYGGVTEGVYFAPDKHQKEEVYHKLIDCMEQFISNRKLKWIEIKRNNKSFEDELIITLNGKKKTIALKTRIQPGYSSHYEIENYARRNSDLVIMTTHGHSGFAHLLMGSTTEKVIQYLGKPVLTIRPSASEFKKSQKSDIGPVTWDPVT
jgi:nucleotide-binding universal stress UspA family protein